MGLSEKIMKSAFRKSSKSVRKSALSGLADEFDEAGHYHSDHEADRYHFDHMGHLGRHDRIEPLRRTGLKSGQRSEKGLISQVKDLYVSQKSTCTCCREWVEEKPFRETGKKKLADSKLETFAIHRRREPHGGEDGWKTHSIIIHSPRIQSSLEVVFKGYPVTYGTDFELTLTPAYIPFYHRWNEFSATERDEKEPLTKEHLALLRGLLEEEMADGFKRLEANKSTGIAEFPDLELLLSPGDILVNTKSKFGNIEAGILRDISLCEGFGPGARPYYRLRVDTVDWNGKRFGFKEHTWILDQFQGSRRLSELSIYPLQEHPDRDKIRRRLIERGRKFENLRGQHFKFYSGSVAGTNWFDKENRRIAERVVVDARGYYMLEKLDIEPLKPLDGSGDEIITEDYGANSDLSGRGTMGKEEAHDVEPLSDDLCLLACSFVRAFALESKSWYEVQVDGISEIKWTTNVLQKLVLNQDDKDMILGCLDKSSKPQDFDDFIEGKGKGIISLFCGPPGTGKTLTAESMSEHLQRPLYRLGVADISTSVSHVEENLKIALERCSRWNAVMLIYEADVFLEARSKNNLERNELVSVFLRLLEYYGGVMVLTTNRTVAIDPAFESRIDIALVFNDLNVDARRQIWHNFMQSLDFQVNLSDEDMDRLAQHPLNGRHIKSAVKMALMVARARGNVLGLEHLEVVIKNRLKATNLLASNFED